MATRKFSTTNAALICGSHYLSTREKCYIDIAVNKKDRSPSVMKAHINIWEQMHWESQPPLCLQIHTEFKPVEGKSSALLIVVSLFRWEALRSSLVRPYINSIASGGHEDSWESIHGVLFPAMPPTPFVVLTKSPHLWASVPPICEIRGINTMTSKALSRFELLWN